MEDGKAYTHMMEQKGSHGFLEVEKKFVEKFIEQLNVRTKT